VTIRLGAFVAGGADSSGYLSQARLWETGSVIRPESVSQKVDWLYADWTFCPVGYRPGIQKGTVVPIYSVGYPMVMGLVRRVFGARTEMYVVPIAAAGLVVCTAILGTWMGGFLVGAVASLLLATSPPFVLQSLQPMSDVPTAFWWALAAVLGRGRKVVYSVVSAAAVILAILTRPNLAPLAVPLVLLVLAGRKPEDRSSNWTGAIIILIAATLGAGLVAYLNTTFYGAPDVSGYGAAGDLYQLTFGPVNLARYTGWLIQTETVLILATLAGVVLIAVKNELGFFTAAVVAIVLLSYLFYRPFDNWTYLRFFLPAYPFLFVALVSLANINAFGGRPGLRQALIVILTLVIVSAHIKFILDNDVLKTESKENKYLEVTDYVQRALPANAIFISHQYTGSLRYYTDRAILRYDWLQPDRLDYAVRTLEQLGYTPYFLLEDWEEPIFRDRFVAYSRLAKLDWYPSVEFRTNHVRVYDPAKRPAN
jgi:hypothetical protein